MGVMRDEDIPFAEDPLEDTYRFYRRFVWLTEHQGFALALWAAHTHAFTEREADNPFDCTPYLKINSPLARSGKSRLLEVSALVVRDPIPTVNISGPALYRVTDARKPTLLLDEGDAMFSRERGEELRGILNAGFRRGGTTHRMGGANRTKLETFSVFCPKAFAGIGDFLAGTTADRCIAIRLERKSKNQKTERLRLREAEPQGYAIRDRLAEWVDLNRDRLAVARPVLPDELDDRAQDVWEPLFAIADAAAGPWPERARIAALVLMTADEREDTSNAALVIRDIAEVFTEGNIKTSDLLARLHKIEDSPWGEWNGKPLTGHGLSKLLKPYRIKTMAVKVSGETVRGYKLTQFTNAIRQVGVLDVTAVTAVTSKASSQAPGNGGNAGNAEDTVGADAQSEAPSGAGEDGYLEDVFDLFQEGEVSEAQWKAAVRADHEARGTA